MTSVRPYHYLSQRGALVAGVMRHEPDRDLEILGNATLRHYSANFVPAAIVRPVVGFQRVFRNPRVVDPLVKEPIEPAVGFEIVLLRHVLFGVTNKSSVETDLP